MSLMPCDECGREISTYAQTCPGCGLPKPHYQTPAQRALNRGSWSLIKVSLFLLFGVPFLLFVVLFVLAGLGIEPPPVDP